MSRFTDPDQPASPGPQEPPDGVRHVPGVSDGMLSELAPLLGAEGIDLDHLDDVEPRALQSAMESAVERRNMELFTPTGAHRTQALAVLRAFTEATAGHNTDRAQAVLDAVEPEETDTRPAISHVLGAGLGLLDSWFADRRYRKALTSARVSSRRRQVRASATDVLAAARRRAAFASLDDLTIDHGGLALFEGVATVVAAAVAAIAKRERRPVARVAADLLVPDADYASIDVAAAPQGRDFGYAQTPASDPTLARILAQFEQWLTGKDHIMAPSVSDEVETLRGVAALGATAGADLASPDDMSTFVRLLVDMGSDGEEDSRESMTACLMSLDEYVHFQWDRSPDPAAWDDAHDVVEDALNDAMPEGDTAELAKAVVAALDVDPDVRLETLRAARICTAVPEFLEWLGRRIPVTQSGNLRLADIRTVAAMLGVSARGVRKLPAPEPPVGDLPPETPLPDPQTYIVRSMRDVPVLEAWWEAMQITGIITINSTSALPGPDAAEWSGEAQPTLETIEGFASIVVTMILTHGADRPDPLGTERIIPMVAALRTLAASAPDLELPADDDMFNTVLAPRALQRLAWLQQAGLMERDAEGRFITPEGARPIVTSAAMGVLTASRGGDEEEYGDAGDAAEDYSDDE